MKPQCGGLNKFLFELAVKMFCFCGVVAMRCGAVLFLVDVGCVPDFTVEWHVFGTLRHVFGTLYCICLTAISLSSLCVWV